MLRILYETVAPTDRSIVVSLYVAPSDDAAKLYLKNTQYEYFITRYASLLPGFVFGRV